MKIAVTGGTGFVGRHVVRLLADEGHCVVVIARGIDPDSACASRNVTWVRGSVTDRGLVHSTLAGCDAVAHLAGVNLERNEQSLDAVHVHGTQNIVAASRSNAVQRIVLLSLLRAGPGTESPFHEAKWRAEEIVRNSGLAFTVFKSAVIYGNGDHMLDHLGKTLHSFPVFPFGGRTDGGIRPVAVADAAWAIAASLVGDRLENQTVALVGPDELPAREALRRIARATGMPVRRVPRASLARVKMLAKGTCEPWGDTTPLPPELTPVTHFTTESIAAGYEPAT